MAKKKYKSELDQDDVAEVLDQVVEQDQSKLSKIQKQHLRDAEEIKNHPKFDKFKKGEE